MEFHVIRPISGVSVLAGEGEILAGDAARLEAALNLVTRDSRGNKILFLNSPGGMVQEALMMSRIIETNRVTTVVPPGYVCASACAQILFIAGAFRMVIDGGKLGLHSCSREGVRNDLCNERIAEHAIRHGVEHGAIAGPQNITDPSGMMWYDSRMADCWGLSLWPSEFRRGRSGREPSQCATAMFLSNQEFNLRSAVRSGVIVSPSSAIALPNICSDQTFDRNRLICSDNDLIRTYRVLILLFEMRLAICIQDCDQIRSDYTEWFASHIVACQLTERTQRAVNFLVQKKSCLIRQMQIHIDAMAFRTTGRIN
jgi:hypothetical protein